MPPKIKITLELILNGALDLVREEGIEAINARNLAKALGCSTQPIFSHFATMDELKMVVFQQVEQLYNDAMIKGMEGGDFLGMGLAYIQFARTEPKLFQLLFMTSRIVNGNLTEVAGSTEGDDEVITMISAMTGLSSHSAQKLYTSIWFTTHGIASLIATNGANIDEKEARGILGHTFKGLIYSLKQESEDSSL